MGFWERVPIHIFAISGDVAVRATWRAVFAKMFLGNNFNADPMTPYVNASGGTGRGVVPVHTEQHSPIGIQLAAPRPYRAKNLCLISTCI
jgi:hypothetical protein